NEPPPPEGYSIVLSLNGHGGSAQQQVQSDGIFWYGDAFARRGYVVLAVDISHRPPSESGGHYWYPVDGDSPETGNHAHPAIAAPGFDSDWAENGERVWDAMRGIDFLLSQPSVNPNRIIVTGLSMGGEITEIVTALDPRVTIAIPASAPPDLALMPVHGNHPCWQWSHGNATEFIEMSDFLALAAPRRVVLESGKTDYTYSSYAWPYAVEKENAWRARIAYGDDATNLLHYVHSGDHQFRVGDSSDDSPYPAYIQVPQQIAPPVSRRRTIDWELDGETVSIEQTLFDYLAR
ncbi:MAG: dienelactone hydrolase family protein, partial [Polyangiaceae bacterium]